ncbi:MAG: hypothetical protein GVY09_14170 [Gammaproteobacteria bacterium]|jgi:hypothetical protein|nr:hypothetical protein [Gammaproteobacteria bacterium]
MGTQATGAAIDSGHELGWMHYWKPTPPGETAPTEVGTDLTGNQGPFTNIPLFIWSSTEFSADDAWYLLADGGFQVRGNMGLG